MKKYNDLSWAQWQNDCFENGGVDMAAPDDDQFRAFSKISRNGDLYSATSICSENVGTVSTRSARLQVEDRVTVQLIEKGGSTLRMNGTDAIARPGDIIIRDWTRAHQIASFTEKGLLKQAMVVSLPRGILAATLDAHSDASAMRLHRHHPATRVTTAFMRTLGQSVSDLSGCDVPSYSQMAVELINNAVLLANPADDGREAKALARVKAELANRMWDPNFSLKELSETVGMSPRTVQRLFQSVGTTPLRWAEEQKLERVAQKLQDGKFAKMTLTEIAFSHGFNDVSTFSRAFKRRFGVNPSEFRTRLWK